MESNMQHQRKLTSSRHVLSILGEARPVKKTAILSALIVILSNVAVRAQDAQKFTEAEVNSVPYL